MTTSSKDDLKIYDMKNLSQIILLFVILLLISCKGNIQTETIEVKQSSFEVFSVHEIEVISGTDLLEFETFVNNKIAPIYNNMEGQYFTLVKGDRGIRTNKYTVLLTFDSLKDRDRIYPPSGGFVGDFGADETWDQLNSMLDKKIGETFTDYIKIVD